MICVHMFFVGRIIYSIRIFDVEGLVLTLWLLQRIYEQGLRIRYIGICDCLVIILIVHLLLCRFRCANGGYKGVNVIMLFEHATV